jgi:plasmid stabilization system protein ParE
MKFSVLFRSEAERDLIDIEDYYNKVSDKIKRGFFEEFFDTLSFVEQNPELFQIHYKYIRIAPLYRFPYGVHYRITGNKVIIYRVLHFKRYFK